jgi:hypothetical protein
MTSSSADSGWFDPISPVVWLAGNLVLMTGLSATAQEPPKSVALPTHELMLETLLDVPSNYSAGFQFTNEYDSDWPLLRSRDTSLFAPTLPSLWWSRDQLPNRWSAGSDTVVRIEGYRLVRDWTSFHSQSADTYVIDIQVDPQYWNRFNYFQQYAILNQFGTTGMSYGYHTRVYSSINLVGVHACDFSAMPQLADKPQTEVPIPNMDQVICAAEIGPFIDYSFPTFDEDLFAPP